MTGSHPKRFNTTHANETSPACKIAAGDGTRGEMRRSNKGRRARHVIVIAGAPGSGKTHLIKKLSQPPHDAFTLNVLEQLGCDPNQR
ncbi:MAG: hypothetical protein H2063_08315, partial [Synechococcus sp.]|nr:hypothetical protein [Synechococcus sp.]